MEFNIRCPITTMIMAEPVLAHDGIAYERQAIITWFKDHDKSPYTRKVINKDIIPVIHLKSYIEDYLKEHSDLKEELFVPQKSHSNCKDQIGSIIKDQKWDELKKYDHFDMSLFTINDLNNLLLECKDVDVLKYVIDNIINLEYENPRTKMRLIHYVCNNTSLVLQYIIDKSVELHCCHDKDGWTPLHYACHKRNHESIRYLIKKGAKLDCVTNDSKTALQILLENRPKYIIIGAIKSFNKLKRTNILCLVNNKRINNSDLIGIMDYVGKYNLIDCDERMD